MNGRASAIYLSIGMGLVLSATTRADDNDHCSNRHTSW